MKEPVVVNIRYENGKPAPDLSKSKVIIVICPSFEIEIKELKITPEKSIRPSQAQLLDCMGQLGAREVCFLFGRALLYWDYLLLASLKKAADKDLFLTESKKPCLELSEHPEAEKIKKTLQREEKEWVDSELNELRSHSSKFILSGDLLDNRDCKDIYRRLKQHCESPEGQQLAMAFHAQTEKFIKNHFKDLMHRKDLVKDNPKMDIKSVVKQYMIAYTQFEFSIFAYLAFQGAHVLAGISVDKHIYKIMNMVMTYISTITLERGLALPKDQKMQMGKLNFNGEPSSPSHSPSQTPPQSPRRQSLLDPSPDSEVLQGISELVKADMTPALKLTAIRSIVDYSSKRTWMYGVFAVGAAAAVAGLGLSYAISNSNSKLRP